MRIVVLGVLSLALLQGCAGAGPHYADSAVDARKPVEAPAGNGYVALSLAQSDYQAESIFGSYGVDQQYRLRFVIRNRADGRLYRFDGESSTAERLSLGLADDDDIPGGHVLAHTLPEGDYEVANITVRHIQGMPNGVMEQEWRGEQDFSLPFSVAAGGVHYLGEWRCIPQSAEGLFGLTVRDGCLWEIADRFDRDLAQLRKKFPKLAWSRASNDTLKSGVAPPGLITFKP